MPSVSPSRTRNNAARSPGRPILAGGAVVTREDQPRGTEVLIIHRKRYDDWTLPKGKIEVGESVPACAVREVREETGVTIRLNVPLDRDVIFLAEAGEEASTEFGIKFMVENHWPEIDAEYCFAEGGGVTRTGGQVRFATVQSSVP